MGPRDILLGSHKERRDRAIRPNLRARIDALRWRTPSTALAALGVTPGASHRVVKLQAKSYAPHFGPLVDHPRAEQVRRFDPVAWERSFKFSFVRNPFARIASMYVFLNRKVVGQRPSFPVFVRDLIGGAERFAHWRHVADSWPVYAIGDRVVADYVGRDETLADDFRAVCGELRIPARPLERSKVSDRYRFRDLYDPETRRLVQRLCEREIDHFGYRFED